MRADISARFIDDGLRSSTAKIRAIRQHEFTLTLSSQPSKLHAVAFFTHDWRNFMTAKQIIKAWKDNNYRNSLSAAERDALLVHPAGWIELDEAALKGVSGGVTLQPSVCCHTQDSCAPSSTCCYSAGGPIGPMTDCPGCS